MRRLGIYYVYVKNALQNPTSDVTDTTSMFFTVYDSNTIHQRELHICARSEVRVCALLMSTRVCVLLMSARTNLLTACVSSRPLALKCLNWQSLHEFSLNTDINVCCSGLTCARALSAPG